METEDLGLIHIQTWSCVYYKPIEQWTQPGFQSTPTHLPWDIMELQAGLGAKRTGKNSLNFRMVPSMICSQKPEWKEIGDYAVINILLLPFIVLSSVSWTFIRSKNSRAWQNLPGDRGDRKRDFVSKGWKEQPQRSLNEFSNFSGTPGSQKKKLEMVKSCRNGQIMWNYLNQHAELTEVGKLEK